MFSSFNSSSEANHQQQHHQQLPFACTFLQHQEDAQQLDQFRQLQPLSHYDNQQTLTDVVISRKSSVTRSLPTLNHRHVRKDRHSKVNTTQGLRNRRIRLSIGIARRFFDLQEMLGFDKPSKTLEWLLGSSTKAIKKLGKIDSSSSHSTASLTSSSPCSNCTAGDGAKAKKMKKAGNELDALARESRAKARARARERTLEKLTSRANCIQLMKVKDDSSPHFSVSNLNFSLEDQGCNNLSNKVLIADSNKTISTSIHRQQNLVIAREDCYLNNLDYYLPTLPSSWDFESVINAYLCTEASIHGKGMGIHNK